MKMATHWQGTLLVIMGFTTAHAAIHLPPYIQLCPRESTALNECAVKQAPKILEILAKGDRKYDIPSLDPFYVELMQVNQPGIVMNFTNMQLIGMSHGNIKNISLNESEQEFSMNYFMSNVTCLASCSLDADLRVVKLKGQGKSRIVLLNITGEWKAKWTTEIHSDGKEYMKFLDPNALIEPVQAEIQITGLFANDMNLENAMNKLLSENWKDLFYEVKPAVEQALAEVHKLAMRGIMRRVPIENLFT